MNYEIIGLVIEHVVINRACILANVTNDKDPDTFVLLCVITLNVVQPRLWRDTAFRARPIMYNIQGITRSASFGHRFFFESSSQGFPVCQPEALTPVADSSERSIERG